MKNLTVDVPKGRAKEREHVSNLLQPPDFRVLFESAPVMYVALTPDFRIVAASDAYLRATLTKREEVLGRGIFDVFPGNPNDPTATGVSNLRTSLERVVQRRVSDAMAVQKYDIRRPESEGGQFEERYWSTLNFPIFGVDNDVAYIMIRVDDVTEFVRLKQRGIEQETLNQKLLTRGEQMEAEIFLRAQEIQEVNRRLREAHGKLENRYQASSADLALANEKVVQLAAIVESSEDAIIGRTFDGIITSWNSGAERLFGYSAEEIIGQSGFALIPPDRTDEFRAIEGRIRQGESVPPFETVWQRKDGSHIHVSASMSPIRDREGRIVGASAILRDISGRMRLEEQLHQAQKMEAVGQLAGGVAHDFNNLLTIISGYSDMLISRLPADDPTRSLIQEIHKAGDRAALLTRQLLTFSRKAVVERRVLDLNAIVSDTEKMLLRLIGEDIAVSTVLDRALGRVKGDAGQMEQIIMNLVVNARDAMPQGGKLTIETQNVELGAGYAAEHLEVKPGRYVLMAVTDTGCGMSEETKARIFEPFFTTKGVGKGTGLGLATVFGIVKQSGGHIGVYSELGRGTTFKIYLPPVEELAHSDKFPHAPNVAPYGEETILLVEDEDGVRALTRLVLQTHGYTVLEAKNGKEALRIGEQHQGLLHLLITDVVMPEMGGRQAAEHLTACKPGIKVLFLSGYTDDAVVRHGILEAEVAFLQKPFTPVGLAKKVREVLDGVGLGVPAQQKP
jgi:PAS domain S-box-containing protein